MMGMLDRFRTQAAVVDEDAAEVLSSGEGVHVVGVRPPHDGDGGPASVPRFVHEIMELQSRWKLWNASPVTVFEIRRDKPEQLRLQLCVPTKRLLRKVRLHLAEAVPDVEFTDGVSGLPIDAGDTVGGGLLTTGRPDYFPLETEFDRPPTNNVVAALHRDVFPSESVVVQLLFRPLAGRPVRSWWWRRKAFRRVGWLKQEKHATVPWKQRPATKIERKQARAVEEKARSPQFSVAVRFLVTNTREDMVRSRVKELGGAYNIYESDVTNQYLDTYTVSAWTQDGIRDFAEAVAYRDFTAYVMPFRASIPELAGLIALPTIDQANLQQATP